MNILHTIECRIRDRLLRKYPRTNACALCNELDDATSLRLATSLRTGLTGDLVFLAEGNEHQDHLVAGIAGLLESGIFRKIHYVCSSPADSILALASSMFRPVDASRWKEASLPIEAVLHEIDGISDCFIVSQDRLDFARHDVFLDYFTPNAVPLILQDPDVPVPGLNPFVQKRLKDYLSARGFGDLPAVQPLSSPYGRSKANSRECLEFYQEFAFKEDAALYRLAASWWEYLTCGSIPQQRLHGK